MKVNVLVFASLKESLGSDQISVELPPEATAAQLRDALVANYPAARDLLLRSMIAVNQEFARDSDPIPAEAEIAVIPPVSGG
jgi:molybdopterin converting factor subunit 1